MIHGTKKAENHYCSKRVNPLVPIAMLPSDSTLEFWHIFEILNLCVKKFEGGSAPSCEENWKFFCFVLKPVTF